MEKLILKTFAGNDFNSVAKEAKSRTDIYKLVEFEFNGVTCFVNNKTNLDWLYRDYSNSWTMGWKEVGPDCVEKYSGELQKQFNAKTAIREEERRKRQAEYDKKDKEEREATEKRIMGVDLELVPEKEKEYAEYVGTNSKDGYSAAVIEYGEVWAKLMQKAIAEGNDVKDIADVCQKNLGYLGITGFQYGCVVKVLSHFWKHGEELRLWHNKRYGVSEDKKGVVNPAVLTIAQ